ncbi:hypothetical protein L596_002757 [Steinernema carpocapsae]|uniref:Uncharacterized protein n=1 Tax=Steinernema carpocapsae TaxID=34508 RepID=A0A4U8UQM6_STECR|nr:hypothetical protein L596_002757 [Steinernema carpocapsae]
MSRKFVKEIWSMIPSPYYPVTYPTEYVRIPIAIVRSGSGSPSYPSYPSQYTTPDTNSDSYAFPEMNSHNYRPSDEILSNYAHLRNTPLITRASIRTAKKPSKVFPQTPKKKRADPSRPQKPTPGLLLCESGVANRVHRVFRNSGDASHSSKPYEFNPEDNSARWRRMRWH